MHVAAGPRSRLGQMFVAFDLGALAGSGAYPERIETLVPARVAVEGVRLPGTRRETEQRHAREHGVEISVELLKELSALAESA